MTARPAQYSARYHVAGTTDRGPVGVCPRVTSMSEYELHYGGRTEVSAVVYDDLSVFFAEGGWEARVARVVGPGASTGAAVLLDGAGAPTVDFTFRDPGGHSGDASVTVTHPGDGTYTVALVQGTTTTGYWPRLVTPADLVSAAEDDPTVVVTDLLSATPAPGNQPAAGTTVFSAGSDDLASVTVADYRAALDATGGAARGGCVAVPALPIDTVGQDLLEHARQFQKIALLCGTQDAQADSLAASAAAVAALPGSDHAGVFWPYISLPGADRPRHLPPTGYVAAVRARTYATLGYWRQPAGARSTALTISALRFPNTPARNEELGEQWVNPIVTDRTGVQVHGWWSLSPDRANFPYLATRDLLNNIAVDLAAGYASAVNHNWDTMARLTGHVTAVTKGVLGGLAAAGALEAKFYEDGSMQDPGYTFSVTTPEDPPADRNVVEVTVAVRPHRHPNLVGVRVFRVDVRDPLLQEALA